MRCYDPTLSHDTESFDHYSFFFKWDYCSFNTEAITWNKANKPVTEVSNYKKTTAKKNKISLIRRNGDLQLTITLVMLAGGDISKVSLIRLRGGKHLSHFPC